MAEVTGMNAAMLNHPTFFKASVGGSWVFPDYPRPLLAIMQYAVGKLSQSSSKDNIYSVIVSGVQKVLWELFLRSSSLTESLTRTPWYGLDLLGAAGWARNARKRASSFLLCREMTSGHIENTRGGHSISTDERSVSSSLTGACFAKRITTNFKRWIFIRQCNRRQ